MHSTFSRLPQDILSGSQDRIRALSETCHHSIKQEGYRIILVQFLSVMEGALRL